ncbi:MAG: hypothetical protein R3326_00555 [Gemmatimonadota bacterium]|nr:hypothetical protein [Gemmatimonadota bacterium]
MRLAPTLSRSLLLITAWLLYACADAPTAPSADFARAPELAAELAVQSEAIAERPGGTPQDPAVDDPLAVWALDAAVTTPDRAGRIARAILELTEQSKEIHP